jgi:enhancing lycopene biosynthesis protein 2
MAKIGVLISGCGFKDGAEIHESVCTLLAVSRHGHTIVPLAPDIPQREVVNHGTGEPTSELRSVRVEAARIFRGPAQTPDKAGALDALILPGGYGAVTNLCDFATRGTKCTVEPATAALIRSMVSTRKPVGAWCIAPVTVAAVLRGDPAVRLTIGTDESTAKAIKELGATHVNCAVDDCVVDKEHKIVSTPAYMLAKNSWEVLKGIDKAVDAICKWL